MGLTKTAFEVVALVSGLLAGCQPKAPEPAPIINTKTILPIKTRIRFIFSALTPQRKAISYQFLAQSLPR